MQTSTNPNYCIAIPEGATKIGRKFSLLMRAPGSVPGEFPTSCLAKGLILCCEGRELCEEGLGFGVPLLKYGGLDVFPGSARINVRKTANATVIEAEYQIDLVKKFRRKGKTLNDPVVYHIEDWLGRLHRALPVLRSPGNRLVKSVRDRLGLKSVFETIATRGAVGFRYTIPSEGASIGVEADFTGIDRTGLTQIIIANEQGASHFNGYRDSDGLSLTGGEIGTWDEVKAGRASFIDSADGISFSVPKIEGAKLFRGRESEAGRLSWSGLLYILRPETQHFLYAVNLEQKS